MSFAARAILGVGAASLGLVSNAAQLGWKGLTGGYATRAAFGGIAGATYGAFEGDYNNSTHRMGNILEKGIQGAALGATLGIPGSIWRGMEGTKWARAKSLMKGSANLGWAGTKAGFKAGRFAFEHPWAVAGGVGATAAGLEIAAYGAQPLSSPTLSGIQVNTDYNNQAIAAEEMMMGGIAPTGGVGSAPQMMGPMHRALQRSTPGLVQGLHQSRHGG